MKNASNRRERRLTNLAADLAELQRRAAQQRIQIAITDAKRRAEKHGAGRSNILKPYQIESAIKRIGEGEPVLSISRSLHCASAAIYRALAGYPCSFPVTDPAK